MNVVRRLYTVYRVSPAKREDNLNGNGRLGFPVKTITASHLKGKVGFACATAWCEQNLDDAGTYIIMAETPDSLPKFKLIELEAVTPKLRVVPA